MTYTGIAITGRAGAGKTTLARAILELTRPQLRAGSFAAALKDDLALIGCEKGDPGFRELAQIYGTEHARTKYGDDHWIDRLRKTNRGTLAGLVIDDMRFVNEASACRSDGLLILRVTANPAVREARLGYVCPEHASESALEDYPVDAGLYTDGHLDAAALAQIVVGYMDRAVA